jgi:DNA-binding NtrC family response regulator
VEQCRSLLYLCPGDEASQLLPVLSNTGWDVCVAESADDATDLIAKDRLHVGLVPLDQWSDKAGGEYFLPGDLTSGKAIEWIALLGKDALNSRDCRNHIANHFYDYHTLPIDPTRLLLSLGHAYGMANMSTAPAEFELTQAGGPQMVGVSPAMQELFSAIRKVARVDAPVMIAGESGTGKELAARTIHERSGRAAAPFVAVNCGALPATLIQSELFGHEKGAFTGAHQRKVGFIEAAAGGTLFLDEVGDLPLDLQGNLLRFLQEGTIERVGSREKIHVDARVIAATHVDLEEAVGAKRFREDLYYRLNVLSIRTPALREREGDIELLARRIFDQFANEHGGCLKGFSEGALKAMRLYDWPGNVRELINRIRRAIVMSDGKLLTKSDIGLDLNGIEKRLMTLDETRSRAERDAIRRALDRTSQNVSLAARCLGVSRITLYRLLHKYDIQP